VVSIGSIEALPDKISKEQSLIDWGTRIRDMAAPVKKHTMDYMLDKIMDENNSKFYRYELKAEAEWNKAFYMEDGGQRLGTVRDKA